MKKKILGIALGIGITLGAVGGYGYYEHFFGGRCNPRGKCTACKNCTACKHCHYNGGTCSVCRR
ncbi:hypothetical protein [Bergeyella zoohelcum]|uniref:hypothetical protein n=1 Tax=Bergeyella zoohelcum TaxID=1015 RepID=UPI000F62CE3E|nr:hypothetical protein [Bergeyella zoohelcum]